MMEAELEARIDALFQLAPADMVKARNALSDELKKAGDKENAARVKGLARPSPAAFALNRLHAEQHELLDEALAQAEHVRGLHADEKLDPTALRQALSAQRAAVSAIVSAAEACFASANLPYGLPQQRKLLATVQGWLSGLGDEPVGRMTHDLEPGGFTGVQVVAGAVPPKPDSPSPSALGTVPRPKGKSQARREAERALELSELRLKELEARQRAQQAEAKSAEAELTLLTTRIEEAERALQKLREQYHRIQANVNERAQGLAQTLAELLRAQAGLEQARDVLACLPEEAEG